ncbi:hypothetical protein BSPWISOXPB_1884 [uncultured Gammaproteobacteria bacterium]|nr:hypothetical protein BSPWISOXPB_1884 [uncultured Gammaproteobacteria bacterium]
MVLVCLEWFLRATNEWTHGQKQGVPISMSERMLAKNGIQTSRKMFWASRDLRGDPFASTALDVVYNRGLGMIENASSLMNNERLGVNLMVDYVRWVDRDYADINLNNWRGFEH